MKKLDNYRVYNEIYHWQNCCHHKIFIDFDFDDDFFFKENDRCEIYSNISVYIAEMDIFFHQNYWFSHKNFFYKRRIS